MAIYSLEDLRRTAPEPLKNASDVELIDAYARNLGADPREVAKFLGVPTGERRGAFTAGIASGVDQLQGLGYSALGGASRALGIDTVADWANKQADIQQTESYLAGKPELERVEDVTLGSAPSYLAYQIGKQVPIMAGITAAQLIPGGGQAATGLGLTRLGTVAPRALGGGGLEAGASFAARREAVRRGEALGADLLKGGTIGAGMGYGSLYQESREGGDESPYLSALGAIPYGLAEALVPTAIRSSLVRGGTGLAGRLPTRVAKAAGIAGIGEAGTELTQNELEMLMRGDLTEEEIASRRLNAAVAGGLVGGTLGSFGGIRRGESVNLLDQTRDGQADAQNQETLQLGYSPLAGTPIVFPDGTVTLSSDQELQARYGIVRPATATQPTVALPIPGAAQATPAQQATQQAASQQRAAQEIQEQEYLDTAQRFGLTAAPDRPNTWDIAGKRMYSNQAVQTFINELAVASREKTNDQKALESAVVAAGLVQIKDSGTAKNLISGIARQLEKFQIADAPTVDEAATRLNDQIARLTEQGKGQTDKTVDALARMFESLTGQTAPAFEALQISVPATIRTQDGAQTAQTQQAETQRPQAPAAAAPAAAAPTVTPEARSGLIRQDQGAPAPSATTTLAAPTGATQAQPVSMAERGGAPEVGGTAAPAPTEIGRETWDAMDISGVSYTQLSPEDRAAWDRAAAEGTATGEMQDQLAEKTKLDIEASFAEQILDRVISRVIKSPKKAEYFATYLTTKDAQDRNETNNNLAAYYGVSLETIKDWNKQLQTFLEDKATQLREAFQVVSVELRVEPTELQRMLQEMNARGRAAEAEVQQTLQPDEVVLDTREVISEDGGMTEQTRKGASVQEKYNAPDTINARYISLLQQLEAAENEGNTELVDEISSKLSTLGEQAAKQAGTQSARKAERRGTQAGRATTTKAQKGKKGEGRAIQEQSTTAVSVQPRTRGGEEMGQEVRGAEGPAREGEAQVEGQTQAQEVTSKFGRLEEYLSKFKPATKENLPMIGRAQLDALLRHPEFANFERRIVGDNQALYQKSGVEGTPFRYHFLTLIGRGKNGEIYRVVFDLGITTSEPHSVKKRRSVTVATPTQVHYPGDIGSMGEITFNEPGSTPAKQAAERFAREEVAETQAQEVALTTAETAEATWNELRSSMPAEIQEAIPTWNNLTPAQQDRATAFGEDLNMRNVEQVLGEGGFAVQRLNFRALVGEPGVESALRSFRELGIDGILNLVDEYQVLPENSSSSGQYDVVNGRTILKFKISTLEQGTRYSAHVVRHEFGHVVDEAAKGGIYSSQPQMGLAVVEGRVTPTGIVAREVFDLYNNDEMWNEFMSYPFERTGYTAERMQAEMFAQLWSLYTDPVTREAYMSKAPIASAYMRKVLEHVQKSTGAVRVEEKGVGQAQAKGPDVRVQGQRVQKSQEGAQPTAQEKVEPFSVMEGRGKEALNRMPAKNQISKLPPIAQGPAYLIWDTVRNLAKKGVTYGAFLSDLSDMAKSVLPSSQTFVRLQQEQDVEKLKFEKKVNDILVAFDKLPANLRGTGEGSVNRFIKDSTLSGRWGYKIRPDSDVTLDPDLEKRFNAFPAAAQKVIRDVFAHGYETLMELKKSIRANINTEFDAQIAAAKEANDDKLVAALEKDRDAALENYVRFLNMAAKGPYAPLSRFGQYVVVGKSKAYRDAEARKDTKELERMQSDERHYFVEFAETFAEGAARQRELEGQYDYVSPPFEKDAARDTLYSGTDLQRVFYRLKNVIKDNLEGAEGTLAGKTIDRMVGDLHLKLLSEYSARQAQNRRRKVAGASDDMMRSFATQGLAMANFLGSLKNTGKIHESILDMTREASEDVPNKDERRRYYNEFIKRHAMGYEYNPSPLIDGALAATSGFMLITSPAYILQNLTQPFMLSVPYMAGRHGEGRSMKAMFAAYKGVTNAVTEMGLGDALNYKKLPKDVQAMMEDLVNRGRININLSQDLGGWSSKGEGFTAVGKNIHRKLKQIVEKAEMVNRMSTAVAAFRLAKERGATDEAATNYADEVIRVTHGDYSGANAPRFMRTNMGRLITQFRKFQLIQISMFARLFNQAFRGANPEERAAARQALLWMFTHAGVAGGVMGLPGFAAIAAVWGALFGDEDDPEKPLSEAAMRRYFGDYADMMVKGVPAALGVDVSGKIGAGQMLSILPYTDLELSRSGWEKLLTGAAGPTLGGLAPRMWDGLGQIYDGNYIKGIEQIIPKGLSDAIKAGRIATGGVTLRNNDVVLSPDEISFLDAFGQAIGLPTTTITEQQFRNRTQIENEQFFRERITKLKRDYAKAYRDGDSAGMAEARENWRELQEARDKAGFKRQPLSNLLRSPQEQREREARTVGGVQFNRQSRRAAEELPQ